MLVRNSTERADSGGFFALFFQVAGAGGAKSQRNTGTATQTAATCAIRKGGAEDGAMPAKLSVNARASVTAGLAKEVEAVNQ